MMVLVGALAWLVALVIVLYFLARPILFGAVYYPTKWDCVEAMVRIARVRPGERMADVGSGDGRILIAFAKAGAEAHGFEINPYLVWRSRRAIRRARLEGKAFVHWRSFWRVDLAPFDVVVVYGIPYIMASLARKFVRELAPGSRVISNVFAFPRWRPIEKQGDLSLYIVGGEAIT